MVPISIPWFNGVFFEKDPPPFDDRVDFDLLDTLNKNHVNFRKYPKTFLYDVGLSQVWDDEESHPNFLGDDDEEIEDKVIPPSDEVIVVVEHTIMDKLKDVAANKGVITLNSSIFLGLLSVFLCMIFG
ncbi:hypothetical protein Tco_1570306 [Tanacetum coccineum]